ncbi:GNAT family N-acetyltransferase [Gloeocapsa sp. PCC 73106]|uniref:GNAT family N-acetyltransferase n=1 Tax=Gloeocapsa sp. PCC 73106 TaxID=102232 RepID=UPI0002AC8053|nr:GNAT family N-acetyltransferase [Gloeocapsa sp. PCC 73106]ELR99793.1 acetyltransferase, ribosomal protein N-acetylase [Gloeocapsa sp. PCC 73106]
MTIITTPRLKLRPMEFKDLPAFASLNADPRVMEFLPKVLSIQETEEFYQRILQSYSQHGFGLLAADLLNSSEFIGYIGLFVPNFSAFFTPCVEIGWRLAFEHWGKGYATEGAKAVLKFAFDELELSEVVSFTIPANLRSLKVMKKIGMEWVGEFDHPNLPIAHQFRRHFLYKIDSLEFRRNQTWRNQ